MVNFFLKIKLESCFYKRRLSRFKKKNLEIFGQKLSLENTILENIKFFQKASFLKTIFDKIQVAKIAMSENKKRKIWLKSVFTKNDFHLNESIFQIDFIRVMFDHKT